MVARIAFLVLSLLFGANCCAIEKDPLVSLRQDFSGLGARTWELMLKEDGSVVEERYNIYAHDDASFDVVRKVRKVPRQRIQQLVARAAELIKGLPEDVGEQIDPETKKERIVVDPETKAVRIRMNGQKLFAGWSSYESTPPNSNTEEFQRAWDALQTLLRGPDA